MKTARFALMAACAAVLAAATVPAARAEEHHVPAISRVAAQPFQLKQAETHKVDAFTTQSLYRGNTVLLVTPCAAGVAPYSLPVRVELRTTSTLNACGDGITDGMIGLVDATSKQTLYGALSAVNQNFGQLEGTIDGRLAGKTPASVSLRATFKGTFVKDGAGNFTLVNVESHGILLGK